MAAAGVTVFTAIFLLANSFPKDLVKPITPALEVEYADALGLPSLPAMEEIFTMRP